MQARRRPLSDSPPSFGAAETAVRLAVIASRHALSRRIYGNVLSGAGEEELARSGGPKRFGLLQGLMLVQVYRVGGAVFLVALSQGLLPATFAIPAGIGDMLVGITAPLAVLALRRGALLGWVAAIAWNILGILDLVVAVTEGFITSPPALFTLPLVLIPTVAVPVSIALHIAVLALLLHRPMRTYFAQRDLEATA